MSPSTARPRLRTRLIAWYAGSLCCVLLLAAAAVRFAVTRTLERAHVESVESSVELFRTFFRVEIAEYRTVEATLAHIAGELVFEDRAIDMHRPDGTLFVVPGAPRGHLYPTLRAPVRDVSAPLDPELAPGWTIEVHSSAATLAAASRRLDLWLLGGVPVVVCLAALLGWWLAGRALRPIGVMAAEAGRLDPSTGARLTLQDPTDELGRFGASFNAVLDRRDEALEQQRRFLADAAHELRTPMARLRSRAELGRLALSNAKHADVRRLADETLLSLERELHTTSESVSGLLALARADSGATAISMRDGFVDDVIADELPRWRETAASAEVTILLGAFEEVRARFDDALIRRLLGLLLDNAIHYSGPGTRITIHLAKVGEDVQLLVEDQGLGIAENDRELVFRRFFRTATARAHRVDGSGLGLALARWIVEQHGGTIRAEGREDGASGAVLVARWPSAATLDAPATPRASFHPGGAAPRASHETTATPTAPAHS